MKYMIVSGSRNLDEKSQERYDEISEMISNALDYFDLEKDEVVIVHGECDFGGVDSLAETWASNNDVETIKYPAKWDKYNKDAGPIRNCKMAREVANKCEDGGYLLAIPGWNSSGTYSMLRWARRKGLNIRVHRVNMPNKIENVEVQV